MNVVEGDFNIGIQGQNFSILLSRAQNTLVSAKYNGVEFIEKGPKLSFTRAYTDNDRGAGYPFEMAGWKVAGNYSKVTDTQIQIEDDSVKVTYVHELPGLSDVEVKVTYQVDYKGRIFVTANYDGKAGLPNFPEFGLEFAIGSQFTNLSYYGYGAEESYRDKLPGAYLGRYETSVEKTFAPYLISSCTSMRPFSLGIRISYRFQKKVKSSLRLMACASTFSFISFPLYEPILMDL